MGKESGLVHVTPFEDLAMAATPETASCSPTDTNVPLPLGWMLSAAAAKTMQDQLRLDDDVVRNGTAMDEVLKSLPTPSR